MPPITGPSRRGTGPKKPGLRGASGGGGPGLGGKGEGLSLMPQVYHGAAIPAERAGMAMTCVRPPARG